MSDQPTNTLGPAADPHAPEQPRGGIGPAIGYAVAVFPVVLVGLLALLAPGFVAPLADSRASIVGLPVGFLVVALLVLLAVVGVLAVRSIREPAIVALVLVLTSLLALTILAFAPAFILIGINLAT